VVFQSPLAPTSSQANFGPNEWLVDEIYQQYLKDPHSVDRAWWDFFTDYQPLEARENKPTTESVTATTTESPTAAAVDQSPPTGPGTAEYSAQRRKDQQPSAPASSTKVHTAPLKGVAARVVASMSASLTVPTATSVRAVPVKLLIDNRVVINNHMARKRGGKISFTHLIGYALVQALRATPALNDSYTEIDGKPAVAHPHHINLGLAIDIAKPDGTRQLLVPCIKAAETMDFRAFWQAYEDIVRRARSGKLTVDDFAGTTITLTNPGTIGTISSVPRLMEGQGCIVGVGAMEYPAQFQGASEETLARLGLSKIVTLTSTYDHRVIQGAQSGEFLQRIHGLLLGEDDFYDQIFASLRIPYEPVRWVRDISASHDDDVNKNARVLELIHAYRVRGHLMADTDPLEYRQRKHPDLDVVSYGLSLWDLEREFATGGFGGKSRMTLREILGVLRNSYCRTVGIEYMHIQDRNQRRWIQERMENPHAALGQDEQLQILRSLNAAEAFETFLQTKYVGQTRFSLEGAESTIPLLIAILAAAAHADLAEVCIGMPHRGRLNVLVNAVGKSYEQVFREFEGNLDLRSSHGSGDVKYHLGAEGIFQASDSSRVKVSMVANPSHLEAVDPVLEGFVRAKQDLIKRGEDSFRVLPLLLHGDAAFAGQGVVAETLNLSQLRGYRTGGTVHVVVNNQVGFTTAPLASRSSLYATDVARMIEAPIFHVNGDDPEACVRVARLAFQFRQVFQKDVVIDLVCYRRRGHNEADNPSFTQPVMYDLIDAKRSVRKLYTEALMSRGDITLEEAEQALQDYQNKLEAAFIETRDTAEQPTPAAQPDSEPELAPANLVTAISEEVVKRVVDSQVNLPEAFTAHPRLLPQLHKRAAMTHEDAIDWAMGETLALGSLLLEGIPVRLSGQDSRRGTFGQRHAVVVDRKTGDEYTPLAQLAPDQATFAAYDSLLSEFAVMGFEYGYSLARPNALVVWEAQFGDFGNGAQTIVDEFLSSGEQKWGQRSSLVLLLPHGYEGQGPDHSSARIERFLELCAQHNMTVATPSLPANYFHLLRWHAHSPHRQPLVVFTPKSLLRLPAARSATVDFTAGAFQPLIGDTSVDPAVVRRALLCSGKVYYELAATREKRDITDVAILRVERLYPLPAQEISRELACYPNLTELRWVQEEPANQGPWPFMALNLPQQLRLPEQLPQQTLRSICRPASSSPAVGFAAQHEQEQAALIEQAFLE